MKNSTRRRIEVKQQVRTHFIANHIFDEYYYSCDYQTFLERLEKHKGVVKKQIEYYVEAYPQYYSWDEPVYYDYDSLESIEINLHYISGKFNCFGRLRWMIGLLDQPCYK